jgi:hypothetical protein
VTRHKWFRASWPGNLRSLASRLRTRTYREAVGDGFLIDRVREDVVEARFVERLTYKVKVTDPFGHETDTERTEYRQCEFLAYAEFPELEIVDQPRQIGALVSRLGEVNNFRVSISPVEIDVMDWARKVQRTLGAKSRIACIETSDVVLTESSMAAVSVRSTSDARAAANDLLGSRAHRVDRIQLKVAADEIATIQLSRFGSARVESRSPGAFVPTIRNALRAIASE